MTDKEYNLTFHFENKKQRETFLDWFQFVGKGDYSRDVEYWIKKRPENEDELVSTFRVNGDADVECYENEHIRHLKLYKMTVTDPAFETKGGILQMILWARDEDQARRIARYKSRREGADCWMNPEYTRCERFDNRMFISEPFEYSVVMIEAYE
jgi:hypothetical protein